MRGLCLTPLLLIALFAVACAPQMLFTREDRRRVNAISATVPEERASLRAEMAAIHADWTPEVQEAVRRGELMIGMDYLQAVSAWGLPSRRHGYLIGRAGVEGWEYHSVSPSIHVRLIHRQVESVSYQYERVKPPDVPRGEFGYLLRSTD